jgi:hypothetical protein
VDRKRSNREQGNYDRARTDAYNQANYSPFRPVARNSRACSVCTCSSGQFHNQAQDQQYTQNLGTGEFGNNAQTQQMQNGMAAAGFNNQAGAQQFNQDVQNANFANTGRQQQIQEASYLRNLPLNDIAALLGTGGGVQNPTFSNVSQVGVAAPDYMGQVNNTFNAQQKPVQSGAAEPLGGAWRYLRAGRAACAAGVLGHSPQAEYRTRRHAGKWPRHVRVQLHRRQGPPVRYHGAGRAERGTGSRDRRAERLLGR